MDGVLDVSLVGLVAKRVMALGRVGFGYLVFLFLRFVMTVFGLFILLVVIVG